jgi:hypothetical protein
MTLLAGFASAPRALLVWMHVCVHDFIDLMIAGPGHESQ